MDCDSFEYYKVFKAWLAQCDQEEPGTVENEKIIKLLIDIVRTLGRQGLLFRGLKAYFNEVKSGNLHQVISLVSGCCPTFAEGKKDPKT